MKKRAWLSGLVLLLVVAVGLAGCGTAAEEPAGENGEQKSGGDAADKGKVNIAVIEWAEAIAVSNLWKVILEEQGYTVNMTNLGAAAIFSGLADGSLDIFLDAWLPVTHEAYLEEYGERLHDAGVWYEGKADLGLAVPAYVEEVNSIADLETHKELFKGQIIGIDSGAGLMRLVEEKVIPTYNLSLNLVSSSEAAMLSALKKAVENEEPIVVTAWRPHWMFTEWDLKYLEDPETLGEAEEIHVMMNKEFAANNQEITTWLENFRMSEEQLGVLESYIFNEGMNEEEAAKRWIEENRAVVDGWLGK